MVSVGGIMFESMVLRRDDVEAFIKEEVVEEVTDETG
jgi:hypothetical protein